jgi:colanic acid biosynthesis glycosyl transferase WcaI
MKILIYSCHFAPEPIGIGKFTGETASWLAARGHAVRVIASAPNYPHREVAAGYRQGWFQRRLWEGVDVMHCPLWISRRQSGTGRVLQYLSFSATSAPVVAGWGLGWRPDILMTVIPPTSALPAAIVGALLGGSTGWLHVQDFDIDAAFELNFLRSERIRGVLLWAERMLMSANRVVSTITPPMLARLGAKRVKARLVQFPNWADIDGLAPLTGSNPLRVELGIPEHAFVALYSGNLGEKQGIDSLVEVARLVADRPNIRIVIGGEGAGRERLAKLAGGLGNLQLIDLQPLARLNELVNLADVHLLPQRAAAADLVMPSKLGGMLASGRPVIAGAAPGTQLADEVAGCGIAVPPEDPQAMAQALLALHDDSARRRSLGEAARARALSHWNKQAILERFEITLLQARGRSPSSS